MQVVETLDLLESQAHSSKARASAKAQRERRRLGSTTTPSLPSHRVDGEGYSAKHGRASLPAGTRSPYARVAAERVAFRLALPCPGGGRRPLVERVVAHRVADVVIDPEHFTPQRAPLACPRNRLRRRARPASDTARDPWSPHPVLAVQVVLADHQAGDIAGVRAHVLARAATAPARSGSRVRSAPSPPRRRAGRPGRGVHVHDRPVARGWSEPADERTRSRAGTPRAARACKDGAA